MHNTPNLNLFEYDIPADKNKYFNFNQSLNFNWDKIDTFCKNLSDNNSGHISNKSNPHSVTKAQVGLGNVDNTSDLNKPVSNAVVELLESDYQALAEKNEVNGYAGLNEEKKVPCKLLSAAKLAYETGEVMTDEEIFNQILNRKHSTFDLSKFTVVGSPNITDDGIASGFSGSNYIYIPATIFNPKTSTWSIQGSFITQVSSGTQVVFAKTNNTYFGIRLLVTPENKIALEVSANGTSQSFSVSSTNVITSNQNYFFKLYFTGNQYKLDISTDKSNWINFITQDSDITIYDDVSNVFTIGAKGNQYFTGSIDLKQFSITVDGVEVFNGNKTGIDTIKPDNYTVVGTPTISADGIASGFSSSDYIDTVDVINRNKPWTQIIPVKFTDNTVSYQIFWRELNGQPSTFSRSELNIPDMKIVTFLRSGENGTTNIGTIAGNNNSIQLNTQYYFKIEFTGSEYKTSLSTDGENYIQYGSTISSTTTLDNYAVRIGSGTYQWYLKGQIDLNAFKVYVDGDLVYQPCLKIPYTQSKTGSKIVNSIYRDRVNDMAEQFGYANYYTLSDTDFTLPQGEIYGYLEKRARDIAHPVAQPFYRFSDEINEDEVRLEGAEVDKGLYLAIEQDPYLSALCTAGSTADKICLPDFRNRVIYGDVASGYVEPELPNITGGVNGSLLYASGGTIGAFQTTYAGSYGDGDTGADNYSFNFDASRSSSIYKNDGTVKTAGVKVRWLCRWK